MAVAHGGELDVQAASQGVATQAPVEHRYGVRLGAGVMHSFVTGQSAGVTRQVLSVHFAGVLAGQVTGVGQLLMSLAHVPSPQGILLFGKVVGGVGQFDTVVTQLESEQRTGKAGLQVGCCGHCSSEVAQSTPAAA